MKDNERLEFKPLKARLQYSKNWKKYFLVINLSENTSVTAIITECEFNSWKNFIKKQFKELVV